VPTVSAHFRSLLTVNTVVSVATSRTKLKASVNRVSSGVSGLDFRSAGFLLPVPPYWQRRQEQRRFEISWHEVGLDGGFCC